MSPTQTTVKASTAVPLLYRLPLLVIEPLCSLNGAVMALRNPRDYTAKITRDLATYHPANQYLYTQLAGAWLLFGLSEVLVLGLVDDLRVWRLLCAAMLASDVVYHVSSVQAVGGWERFVRFGEWGAFDWAVFVSAVVPMVVRALVVLGVGVRAQGPSREAGKGKGKGE
ncbi:EXPERA domain-containing protein [Madurella fahalii]|uniref:EXPERA domain-containing protein n=1 Tax=Madurella fahalii TaxID=1157608 RepID=A0ABQ0GNA1_9PEZI